MRRTDTVARKACRCSREMMMVAAKGGRTARYMAAFAFDEAVRGESGKTIGGMDEAGRGPLAGPVVAAAVVLPDNLREATYYDSKQLSPHMRETAFSSIIENAVCYGVGIIDPPYIDQYNILQATYEAMRQAVLKLLMPPELMLVDGVIVPGLSLVQRKVIKGDTLSQCIAAASIVAKVTRDRLMVQASAMYPEYGFERHMGYGTPEHLFALRRFGPCPLHRVSFAPVREVLDRAPVVPETFMDVRQRLGQASEDFVVQVLQTLGWRLRDRRFRVAQGEVDVVMEDGDTLVFVEVRSRTAPPVKSGGSPEDMLLTAASSVDGHKQKRLRRLAQIYLQKERIAQGVPIRFDVVAVAWQTDSDTPTWEHYKAAF